MVAAPDPANTIDGIGLTSPRSRETLVELLHDQGITDLRVLDALRQVPRHIFVEEALAHRAYENTALPIGYRQTISQPYMVGLMTQLLLEQREDVAPPEQVLEIGTGSGYQTAVLALLVPQVYSIERIAALKRRARRCLQRIEVRNIVLRHGDGHEGWAAKAPFDAIIATAAAAATPKPLMDQLAEGGRLVIPEHSEQGGDEQVLCVYDKRDGVCQRRKVEAVRFVPMRSGIEQSR